MVATNVHNFIFNSIMNINKPKREVVFSWKGTASDWMLEQYKECYRSAITYENYIEMIRERGLDELKAEELWNELNHKYEQ